MSRTSEQWRAVPGYMGRYEVSDQGRVRSLWKSGGNAGFLGQPKVLKCSPGKRGYAVAYLYANGRRKAAYVHRLVLSAFNGPAPDGQEGRHLNGDELDNRLENLAWGTPAENAEDKRRHGTVRHGSGTGHARLTEDEVMVIDLALRLGVSNVGLAADFGVSQQTISAIRNGHNWGWLTHRHHIKEDE